MKNIIVFSFLALLFFSSCREELNEKTIEKEIDPPIVLVESSLRGRVVNESGEPVPSAVVTVDNKQTVTNAAGGFTLNSLEVKKESAMIAAESGGYFNGIAQSNFASEGSSFVQITMIDKGNLSIIDTNTGGVVSNNDETEITIPADIFSDAFNNPINGNVGISSKYIDPSADNFGEIMPGELLTRDADDNIECLSPFAGMVFEAELETGTKVDIKEGEEAEIKMRIPDDLLSLSPDELDIYLFDLEEERWVPYSKCKKNGNFYTGSVNTTGYYICAQALPSVCLSGNVLNADGTVSSYLKVIVEDLSDNFIYYGYTDTLGLFCGGVPAFADLKLTIEDLCNNVVYTEFLGPLDGDTHIIDLLLDINVNEYILNIEGSSNDCMGAPLSAGYLSVRYPGKIRIYPLTNGAVDIPLGLKCTDFPILEIQAFSNITKETSEVIYHSDPVDVKFGTINTCKTLNDFINVNVDGTEYWTAPTRFYMKDNTAQNTLVLEGLGNGTEHMIELKNYSGVGSYTNNTVFIMDDDNFPSTSPIVESFSPDITVNILSDDGQYIEGNLSGVGESAAASIVNLNATFRVKKQ